MHLFFHDYVIYQEHSQHPPYFSMQLPIRSEIYGATK